MPFYRLLIACCLLLEAGVLLTMIPLYMTGANHPIVHVTTASSEVVSSFADRIALGDLAERNSSARTQIADSVSADRPTSTTADPPMQCKTIVLSGTAGVDPCPAQAMQLWFTLPPHTLPLLDAPQP